MNPPSNRSQTSALRWLSLLALLLALNWAQSARAQSYALTNLWSVTPVTNTILNSADNLSRGMAYNPVTGHLLVVSRTPVPDFGTNVFGTNGVYILDATNGAVVGKLAFDTSVINSGTFVVNMVGVTDDGVIYVGNLTLDAAVSTNQFKLYRWASETSQPTVAYSGDPSGNYQLGTNPRRFGDSLAVRGTGAGTQILLGTYNQTVGLLTTTDGANFTASLIRVSMAASDSRWGLAWGTGNTFWVKQTGYHLRQMSLDVAAKGASILRTIVLATNAPPSWVGSVTTNSVWGGPLDVDLVRNLVAILDTTNHKLALYDISDLSNPIKQDTSRSLPLAGANGNSTGAVALRNGMLFALESNNGLVAFALGQTNVPASVTTQPTGLTLWQGATFTISPVYGGTRPFSFQWQLAGTNLPGATQATLTLTNISFSQAGTYRVMVSNAWGGAVSANANIVVTPGNGSGQTTKVWEVQPFARPYLTAWTQGEPTSVGYKQYGVAINPVNTNVIVVTRSDPTNMLAVMDSQGNHLHYIDYSRINPPVPTPSVGTAMNKVDVADDGTVYVCNFAGTAGTFNIYAFTDDGATPADEWVAFSGDPANGTTGTTNNWGYTLSVRGAGLNTEILIGSSASNQRDFAILTPDGNSAFHSTHIVGDSSIPLGFCVRGLDWGPSANRLWAKNNGGNLLLIEYDLTSGSASLVASYNQSLNLPVFMRNSFPSFCNIKYDPTTGLLAGILNGQNGGSSPSPLSVLLFDATDIGAGPFLVDQKFDSTYNQDIEYLATVDFANGYLAVLGGENNGLMMFRVNSGFGSIPRILTQPASTTSYVGTPATFSVLADSTSGLNYQWYYNGAMIADATSSAYTIPSVTTNLAGIYTVQVTNTGGYRESAPAILTVLVPYQTPLLTNVWSLSPGDRTYLTTDYTQYGLACNPATSNLLVVSVVDGYPYVAVLDALTGADKTNLDMSAIAGSGKGPLHKIGVADDGVVYGCNEIHVAPTAPFLLYRWDDDSGSNASTLAFQGDPLLKNDPNDWAGLTFGVRGAGTNTQILLGSYSNSVSILTTTDGTNFVANEIKVAGAPVRFCRLGLCFGAGDTFWTKSYAGDAGGPLVSLVQYDLAAGTGTNLYSNSSGLPTSSSITTIGYDGTLKMLAGIGTDTGRDSVQLFDASNLAVGPQLRDQELFPTGNPSIEQNGAITFGLAHTYLFALAENNGILAFRINANYGNFKILGVTHAPGSVTLNWEAANGANYQVQRAASLGAGWTDLGSVVTATGDTASYTDTNPDPNMRFYRVQAK